jgi:hypothetical protein
MTRPALLRRLDALPTATAAAAGISGALLIVFVANYRVPAGQNGGTGPGVITGLGCLALAGLLFGLVLPRLRNSDGATLVLAALAVISVVAFWSGATPVLAAAAAATNSRAPAPRRVQLARLLAATSACVAIVAALATSHLG